MSYKVPRLRNDDARLTDVMSWTDQTPPTDSAVDSTHRFGGTLVEVTTGRLADQPVRALVVSANQRGAMGLGQPRSVRSLAGDGVEREAMAHAPLSLGSALRTSSGELAARGIQAILHAVVAPAPGHPATPMAVRRATLAVLELADTGRLRSVATSVLGSGTSQGQLPLGVAASEITETVVAYLRRNDTRIERIVIVTEFDADRLLVDRLVALAAVHHWVDRR